MFCTAEPERKNSRVPIRIRTPVDRNGGRPKTPPLYSVILCSGESLVYDFDNCPVEVLHAVF